MPRFFIMDTIKHAIAIIRRDNPGTANTIPARPAYLQLTPPFENSSPIRVLQSNIWNDSHRILIAIIIETQDNVKDTIASVLDLSIVFFRLFVFITSLYHKKASGKGGHHLRLFWPSNASLLYRVNPGA